MGVCTAAEVQRYTGTVQYRGFLARLEHALEHRSTGAQVGVRGLPERDIWSLCVGWGVGGKSMFLPPSPPSPPLAWTPKRWF